MTLVDERQINKWKTISPKIRQILSHQGYELTGKHFFINSTS